jgi:hypothetical protein
MPEKDKRWRQQQQRAMTTTPKHCAGSTNDTTATGTRRECWTAGQAAWVRAVERYHTQLPTLTAPARARANHQQTARRVDTSLEVQVHKDD